MAKAKTVFVCSDCGYESQKWLGKCPACNSWNTFYEEKLQDTSTSGAKVNLRETAKPQKLNAIIGKEATVNSTKIEELDRVLGGGLVKGSLVLIGGEPRNWKINTYYVSGEESGEQIKLRADRLNINSENIMFLGETDIDAIEIEIVNMNPELVIIDSIQTIFSNEITSAPRNC